MDDYEREAAKEWQVVGPQKDRGPRLRPFIARAEFEPDTQARIQWRERAQPTRSTTLPRDFVPNDKGQQRGRGLGRTDSPATAIPELVKIARDTETEINQHVAYDRQTRKQSVIVHIYGPLAAAIKAEEAIDRWVKAYVPEKPNRSAGWAKVNSVGTPEQRDRYYAKVKEDEEKEQYRRDPPVNAFFPAMGKFEWDTSYSSPGDILGTRLEACDPLRTELECFVMPDKRQAATLRVQGRDPEKVKQALNRLRGSFFQAVSRDNAGHTEPVYLFTPVPKTVRRSRITYEPYYPPGCQVMDTTTVLGDRIRLEPDEIDEDVYRERTQRAEDLPAENAKKLKKAMVKALKTAKYFRGNLRMRATFGVFLLKRYKKDINDFESFEDMMSDGQVDGDVDANSAQLSGDIVSAFIANPGIWDPSEREDPTMIPKPTYSAKFLLKHKHDVPDLKFEAEFEYDKEGDYVHNLAKRWSRNIHAPGHSVKLLDVCLVDIHNGSDAWSIDIDAMESIPTNRAPELTDFAEGVDLNPSIATSVLADDSRSAGRYIDFAAVPGVVVHWLVQKKHWTFEYARTEYLVDVVKAEEFRLRNPSSSKPDQKDLVQGDPMWRVSIYRKSWDVDLAENAHLQLGEGMRSNKNVADFFPTNSEVKTARSDVGHFLHVLNDVRSMIRGGLIE